jgi:hypothetical protein
MADRMPRDVTAAGADGEKAAAAARPRPGRPLIAVMLLTAVVLDLTRCGLVLAAARRPAPTAGLAAAGLAAAVLSARTARGCQAGRRWAGWAALLIGAASAPQAAMSGFHGPYTIPDTATAAVGVLLAVAVLATAGAAGQPGPPGSPGPLATRGDEGTGVVTGATVTGARRDSLSRSVLLKTAAGGERELACGQVLIAAGRRPVSAGLNLSAVGVWTAAAARSSPTRDSAPAIRGSGRPGMSRAARRSSTTAAAQGSVAAANALFHAEREVDYTAPGHIHRPGDRRRRWAGDVYRLKRPRSAILGQGSPLIEAGLIDPDGLKAAVTELEPVRYAVTAGSRTGSSCRSRPKALAQRHELVA